MSKVTVFNLEAGLPLYVIDKHAKLVREESEAIVGSFETDLSERQQQIEQENIHKDLGQEHAPIPEWVRVAAENGYFGELIAKEYLEELYPGRVKHVSEKSSLGYDFEVVEIGVFEIKTTTQLNNNKFHITKNELQVASNKREEYHIMFIRAANEQILGYIIKDPVEALDIPYNKMIKLLKHKNVEIAADRFVINISENYIKSMEFVPLNRFIKNIQKGKSTQ